MNVTLERNGAQPQIATSARIAFTARLVGDVRVGADCVIDHGVVITSSGPPVVLGAGVVVGKTLFGLPDSTVVGFEFRPGLLVSRRPPPDRFTVQWFPRVY